MRPYSCFGLFLFWSPLALSDREKVEKSPYVARCHLGGVTPARVTTWLYRIVLNLSLDRRRKPKPLPIDEAAEIRSDDPEPLAMMIENEDRHRVTAALAALPERQRVAIALFHMEGLSVREAAQSMNVTEKALESLLVRARSAIRKHVESRDRINRRFA